MTSKRRRLHVTDLPTGAAARLVQLLLHLIQVAKKFSTRLITLLGILAQRLLHDPFQFAGYSGNKLSERGWIRFQDRNDYVAGGVADERQAASYHFVEHHSQTPDVCALVNFVAARLFGRKIIRCPNKHAAVCAETVKGWGLAIASGFVSFR